MTLGSINIIYEAITAVPDNSTACGGSGHGSDVTGGHGMMTSEIEPLSPPMNHDFKMSGTNFTTLEFKCSFFITVKRFPRKYVSSFSSVILFMSQ